MRRIVRERMYNLGSCRAVNAWLADNPDVQVISAIPVVEKSGASIIFILEFPDHVDLKRNPGLTSSVFGLVRNGSQRGQEGQ